MNSHSMKRALILIPLIAVSMSACQGKPEKDDAKPVALVTTSSVTAGTIDYTVTAYGEAAYAPQGERVLAAPFEARLSEVLAPPGSTVRAGQAVAILAPSPTAQVDITKAAQDATSTQAAYDRTRRLRAAGLDSDADVEAAHAAAVVAAKSHQLLGGRMDALVLRAPAGGVVESVTPAPGDQVAAGAGVVKIGSLSLVRVRLGVEPATADRIAIGASVRLEPLSGGGAVDARVSAVDPHADAQTRLASVFCDVAGSRLPPGVPVRGAIALRQGRNVLSVPRAALLYEGAQPYVFVSAGGTAHRRDVKIGSDGADRIEISDGLKTGEQVVVAGAAALDDGMAVRLK